MVKKVKMPSRSNEGPLPAIKESAQQIWSVGVDAISRAHQQSNRVFDALVREGESLRENLHKKTRGAAEARVTEVTTRATDTWDKLEQVFEKRVARALGSLGVPTRGELAALNDRIEALTKLVRRQAGEAPLASVKKKPVARKPTTPRTKKSAT